MDNNQTNLQDQNSTQVPVQQQVPIANQTPVGIGQKEQGIVTSVDINVKPLDTELIKPSEIEPQIHPEAHEAGVEKVSDIPELTKEHEKIGIQHAKESVPVSTQPTGVVQLMEEVEAKGGKIKGDEESVHWLWVLLNRVTKHLKSL